MSLSLINKPSGNSTRIVSTCGDCTGQMRSSGSETLRRGIFVQKNLRVLLKESVKTLVLGLPKHRLHMFWIGCKREAVEFYGNSDKVKRSKITIFVMSKRQCLSLKDLLLLILEKELSAEYFTDNFHRHHYTRKRSTWLGDQRRKKWKWRWNCGAI